MKGELSKLFIKYFPSLDFKIILVNSFTIASLFKFKDSLPLVSRSSVVYQYECSACQSKYEGSTHRTLGSRMSEHRGRSLRTDALILTAPVHSAIRDHCKHTCSVPVLPSIFKILNSCSSLIGLRILESLHIFKSSPYLNETNSCFPLHIAQ